MLCKIQCIHYELILLKQCQSSFRDTYRSTFTIAFHFICNQYVLSKNIVSNNFSSNYAPNNLTCVHSYAHIKGTQIWISRRLPNFTNYVDHFEANSHNPISFFNLNGCRPSELGCFPCVPHYYIAVTYRVHFVNSVNLCELIKFTEQFRKELNNFYRILDIVAELSESYHICVKKCDIIQHINYSLIVWATSVNEQAFTFSLPVPS